MMSKYERLGFIAEQIIIKERQIKSWEAKPEGKRRNDIILSLTEEIEELKEKMYALV